mgnify:CR=1 FL=1
MLMTAGAMYLIATIIRISMARKVGKSEKSKSEGLSFSSLKTNLGTLLALLLAGGVITWILITDGVLDTAFAMCMNLLPVYMQEIGGLSLKQIGLLNSLFGLSMMVTTLPGGWLADRPGPAAGPHSGPTRRCHDRHPSTPAHAAAFQALLEQSGIPTTLRMRRGIDIDAGCGQLRRRVDSDGTLITLVER